MPKITAFSLKVSVRPALVLQIKSPLLRLTVKQTRSWHCRFSYTTLKTHSTKSNHHRCGWTIWTHGGVSAAELVVCSMRGEGQVCRLWVRHLQSHIEIWEALKVEACFWCFSVVEWDLVLLKDGWHRGKLKHRKWYLCFRRKRPTWAEGGTKSLSFVVCDERWRSFSSGDRVCSQAQWGSRFMNQHSNYIYIL